MAEFATAVKYELPIKVVVIKNNTLGHDQVGADGLPRQPGVRLRAAADRLRRLRPRLRRHRLHGRGPGRLRRGPRRGARDAGAGGRRGGRRSLRAADAAQDHRRAGARSSPSRWPRASPTATRSRSPSWPTGSRRWSEGRMARGEGGGALEAELRSSLAGEVRFDAGTRALYATDASNYRQVPIGVVLPRTVEDVVAAVAACRRHGAPVLARGGGTSLAGQCCNVAVVLDFSSHLNRILELDPERRLARVEPGIVLDTCATRPRSTASPSAPTRRPTPLHAGRHDRQQLLRRALGHGRQDRRQRRGAGGPDLRRPAAHGRRDRRGGAGAHRRRGRAARARSTPARRPARPLRRR